MNAQGCMVLPTSGGDDPVNVQVSVVFRTMVRMTQ